MNSGNGSAKSLRDREVAAYCQVGQRGYLATRILLQHGYPAANIGGGYRTYQLYLDQPRAEIASRMKF